MNETRGRRWGRRGLAAVLAAGLVIAPVAAWADPEPANGTLFADASTGDISGDTTETPGEPEVQDPDVGGEAPGVVTPPASDDEQDPSDSIDSDGSDPGTDDEGSNAEVPSEPDEIAQPVTASATGATTSDQPTVTTTENVAMPVQVTATSHVQSYGARTPEVKVTEGSASVAIGTQGLGKRLEQFSVNLELPQIVVQNEVTGELEERQMTGGLEYKAYVNTKAWMNSAAGGAVGTTGQGLPIEAVSFGLTGEAADYYDVYYRVHMQGYGWLNWVTEGDTGIIGRHKRLEKVEVQLVRKGATAPTSRPDTAKSFEQVQGISVQVHGQSYGWTNEKVVSLASPRLGDYAGSQGSSKRLEAVKLELLGAPVEGSIQYRVHGQSYGWGNGLKTNGQVAGTTGQSKRLEAISISLTGKMAEQYDVYYRLHCQSLGTMGWQKNGSPASATPNVWAGTTGFSRRAESLEVVLVPKGHAAPSASGCSVSMPSVTVADVTPRGRAYSSARGWHDGTTLGVTGKRSSLEALAFSLNNTGLGTVEYNVHRARDGWSGWKSAGTQVGNADGKSIQAVQLRLTGKLGGLFDVYYRSHTSGPGWLGWAKNGGSAGSTGISRGMESFEVRLVPKGGAAPTNGAYRESFLDQNTKKIGYQTPGSYPKVSCKNVLLSSPDPAFNYASPSVITPWASRQDCINAFITRARQYIGTRYIEPYSQAPGQAVDCSGLVLQCLYATGMDMGVYNPYNHRYLSWQVYNSMNWMNNRTFPMVSLSNRQPGDVIYYRGHITIYVGNDQIIDSWPRRGVTQRSMWYDTPIAVGRPFA